MASYEKKQKRRSLVLAMQLVDSAIAMQQQQAPMIDSDGGAATTTSTSASTVASAVYVRARAKQEVAMKQRTVACENSYASSKPVRRATMGEFGPSSNLMGELLRRSQASPDGKAFMTADEIDLIRDALYGAVHLRAASSAAARREKEEESDPWEPTPLPVAKRANDAAKLGRQLVQGPAVHIMVKLRAWGFDVFAMNEELQAAGNVFVVLGYAIYKDSGLLDTYSLDAEKLCNFLLEVQAAYNEENSYHNGLHGIDVTQTLHYFLHVAGLSSRCSDWERMASITAALVHDMGHFSLNNAFLAATSHPLALTYSYKSTLENMHISKALKVLAKRGCDFMDAFPANEAMSTKKLMIELVLATDMATHGPNLKELEECLQLANSDADALQTSLVLKIALHAADISNPAKPWDYYQVWTDRVLHEFFGQGDKERALGLPVSLGFDREQAKTEMDRARGQIGFIGFVVKPLYEAFAKVPELDISESAIAHLAENSQRWRQIVENQVSERKGDCVGREVEE